MIKAAIAAAPKYSTAQRNQFLCLCDSLKKNGTGTDGQEIRGVKIDRENLAVKIDGHVPAFPCRGMNWGIAITPGGIEAECELLSGEGWGGRNVFQYDFDGSLTGIRLEYWNWKPQLAIVGETIFLRMEEMELRLLKQALNVEIKPVEIQGSCDWISLQDIKGISESRKLGILRTVGTRTPAELLPLNIVLTRFEHLANWAFGENKGELTYRVHEIIKTHSKVFQRLSQCPPSNRRRMRDELSGLQHGSARPEAEKTKLPTATIAERELIAAKVKYAEFCELFGKPKGISDIPEVLKWINSEIGHFHYSTTRKALAELIRADAAKPEEGATKASSDMAKPEESAAPTSS